MAASNKGKPYTKADIAEIKREARDQNVSTKKIADNLGRTEDGIRGLAARQGISLRPKNK